MTLVEYSLLAVSSLFVIMDPIATVPAAKLVKVPDDVDLAIAAAVMLQGTTAHYLTHSTFPLKAGDSCLVHAAAGGTGGLIVQMARHLGARVFGDRPALKRLEAIVHPLVTAAKQRFLARHGRAGHCVDRTGGRVQYRR